MVIFRPTFGLGNQLYCYAGARALAQKLNTELKIDNRTFKRLESSSMRHYRLGAFNVLENFATQEELESIDKKNWKFILTFRDFMGANVGDNVYIPCYRPWMTRPEIIKSVENILREEFTLKNPLHPISAEWKEKILSADCAVSLHIRLGDFLTPYVRLTWGKIMPLDYVFNCISILKKSFPQITIFVFSDNIQWLKKNLDLGVPTEFVEGCETAIEEFYLISLCKHNINSESSFSWWSSWLNKNPDKKIFTMKEPVNYWGMPKESYKYPLIKFPPFISFIIFTDSGDFKRIENCISSLHNQKVHHFDVAVFDFKSYEIIVADSSATGSEEIQKKCAEDKKIIYLRLDKSVGKFSAWNKALEKARGENVIFLTDKNFCFLHLSHSLLHLCRWVYLEGKNFCDDKDYITPENYERVPPDITIALQRVEEIGTLPEKIDLPAEEKFKFDNVLNLGIDGKEFSFTVDEDFKNFEKYSLMSNDGFQKLKLLADKKIDTLLCTKIFKRKFLIENNIRFKENLGADTELLFLVEAFLQTDYITLVNRAFCGTFK